MIAKARVRKQVFPLGGILLALLLSLAPGCATITGVVTGAPTGLIDAPSQVYYNGKTEFEQHPEFWSVNVLIIAPLGLVLGPVAGLVKGIAADMRCLTGRTDYGEVFGTYGPESVWRPWTFHVEQQKKELAESAPAPEPSSVPE